MHPQVCGKCAQMLAKTCGNIPHQHCGDAAFSDAPHDTAYIMCETWHLKSLQGIIEPFDKSNPRCVRQAAMRARNAACDLG